MDYRQSFVSYESEKGLNAEGRKQKRNDGRKRKAKETPTSARASLGGRTRPRHCAKGCTNKSRANCIAPLDTITTPRSVKHNEKRRNMPRGLRRTKPIEVLLPLACR